MMRLAVVLGFALALSASADETTRVVSVDTDAYTGTETLDVVRDASGAMTAMVYSPIDAAPFSLSTAELRSGPQLIKKLNGHNITYLSLESDFTPTAGGHANLKFLSNGVTGSFLNFRILLQLQGANIVLRSDPNPKDPASDHNPYTSVFDHLFMKKKTLLGQTVGISEVDPNEQ